LPTGLCLGVRDGAPANVSIPSDAATVTVDAFGYGDLACNTTVTSTVVASPFVASFPDQPSLPWCRPHWSVLPQWATGQGILLPNTTLHPSAGFFPADVITLTNASVTVVSFGSDDIALPLRSPRYRVAGIQHLCITDTYQLSSAPDAGFNLRIPALDAVYNTTACVRMWVPRTTQPEFSFMGRWVYNGYCDGRYPGAPLWQTSSWTPTVPMPTTAPTRTQTPTITPRPSPYIVAAHAVLVVVGATVEQVATVPALATIVAGLQSMINVSGPVTLTVVSVLPAPTSADAPPAPTSLVPRTTVHPWHVSIPAAVVSFQITSLQLQNSQSVLVGALTSVAARIANSSDPATQSLLANLAAAISPTQPIPLGVGMGDVGPGGAPLPSPSPTVGPDSTAPLPTGAIVGAAFAGLAVLVVATAVKCQWQRRRDGEGMTLHMQWRCSQGDALPNETTEATPLRPRATASRNSGIVLRAAELTELLPPQPRTVP